MHFNRYLNYWAKRIPDQNAFVSEGRTLTWGQFHQASGALAAHLQEMGVGPGDRFGCLLGNCLDWCVSLAAAIRLGAIFVPLNTSFGRYELEQIAGDADCAAIFSRPSEIVKIGWQGDPGQGDGIHLYDLRGGRAPVRYEDILAGGRDYADQWRSDDEPMILCYTSGTTGVPKGIVLTYRAVDTYSNAMGLCFDWKGGKERQLVLAPLAFTGTVICVIAHMLRIGACSYIETKVDGARALNLLIDEKITYFSGVPAVLEPITRLPRFADADLSYLTTCYTGGAPIPRPLLEAYLAKGVVLRQQYACSETSGGICCPTEDEAKDHPESAGHPFACMDMEIHDEKGQVVPHGEVGEICVRGPNLMREYWRKPEATKEAFDGDWYKTGDLGSYTPEIGLIVADRKKNMLISGGVNVYPAEVERAIATAPGVLEVAVIGVPNERWGDEVVAIIHGPSITDTEALLTNCRDLLGKFKTPRRMVLSPDPLPRTATNKIQRKGLDQLFIALAGVSDPVA